MSVEKHSERPEGAREPFQLAVTLVVVLLVAAGAVRVAAQHRRFVEQHPMNLVWLGGSLVAALVVFALGAPDRRSRAAAPWLGYGILAAYLGFALQGGVNDALLRRMGAHPGLWGYAVLGVGAAVCQTFAKWLVLRFLGKLGALRSPSAAVATGLAVGLGFGVAEIVVLAENQIVRGTGILVFPWLGIWERAAAVGLHVFSGAVLAVGIYQGSWLPALVVVALHALDDTIAGAVSAGVVHLSAVATCVFATVVAAALWAYLQALRRQLRVGLPPEESG